MKTSWLGIAIPGAAAAAGVAALVAWLSLNPVRDLAARMPGLDHTPQPEAETMATAPRAGEPTAGQGRPAAISGTWPWFRGSQRDAVCHEDIRLARSWPDAGPPVLWQVEMGEGYAGPVVADGCVYVLDYDAVREADTMRCLSLNDGREIWRNSYPVLVVRNHGMSRTVPAIAGPYVVTIGPRCHVACWERATGSCRWLIDLPLEYGTTVPQWYAGQCPLVDGDRVILAPASDSVLLMAVDAESGEVVWKTPNPHRWAMTHSSILPLEYAGRKMYVYCASGGVVGVAADDGTLLWESQDWKMHVALSPSPLDLGGGRLLMSSGYNRDGSLILQLDERNGTIVATAVRTLTPKQFNSEQQTPILYAGHVFGIRKPRGGQFVCLDLDGNEIYHSGVDKFGLGPYLIADDLIYLLGDRGLLTMAAASTDQYQPLARFQVFADGHDAWGPMALVAGHLVVRDMTRMACVDVRAGE